jgi:hypothetical protein
MMYDYVKVGIDRIEENPVYGERHSPWIDHMCDDLKGFVGKAKTVRIVVKKRGNKHMVVFGHHLLKAARECGLSEVYVHVIDAEAEAGRARPGEDLLASRSGIRELLCRAGI